MVITEKETEGTAEPKTRKKWGKKILIILAVCIGLGAISSFILDSTDDDEAEYTQTKVESTQEQDKSTQTQAQSSDISILVYSDIFLDTIKQSLQKCCKIKDGQLWALSRKMKIFSISIGIWNK